MRIYASKVFLSLLLFFCVFIGNVSAKKIHIAVGWNKPPYVIEKENSGFEIDMLSAIFKKMGYELDIIYTPVGRSSNLLKKGLVDVGMTISSRVDITPAVFSSSYITYHNVAISLRGRGISLDNISQLSKYSIVAFQNANIYLGEEYLSAVDNSTFYIELPDQHKQVAMLLLGRTDIVVMDVNIFNYLSKEHLGKSHMDNVDVHRIFPTNSYHLGFVDEKLRDQFNKELIAYRKSSSYHQLIEKYHFIQDN